MASTATDVASSTSAPTISSGRSNSSDTKKNQWIHILRHGERRDFLEAHTSTSDWHRYDPPLSTYGHTQAYEAGTHIGEASKTDKWHIDRIICSPFIRTVETAWNVVKGVRAAGGRIGPISIEYGVAEWHPAVWIKPFLPQRDAIDIIRDHEGGTAEAVQLATDAIDHDYKTLFPDSYFHDMINTGIGETLPAAASRAATAVDLLTTRFPHQNLLIITHAIHSIGLVRALVNDSSFPVRAGVCSLTSVQRPLSSSTPDDTNTDATPSSSETTSSATAAEASTASAKKWNVIHNGSSSHLSRGEQHWWLIPGEEERVYGVRKLAQPSRVPVYVPLTDEEKAALISKQAAAAVTSSDSSATASAPAVANTTWE